MGPRAHQLGQVSAVQKWRRNRWRGTVWSACINNILKWRPGVTKAESGVGITWFFRDKSRLWLISVDVCVCTRSTCMTWHDTTHTQMCVLTLHIETCPLNQEGCKDEWPHFRISLDTPYWVMMWCELGCASCSLPCLFFLSHFHFWASSEIARHIIWQRKNYYQQQSTPHQSIFW